MSRQPQHCPAQHGIEEALRAIGAMFEPGDVIEIRALNVDRASARGATYSGYFTFGSREKIADAVALLDGHAEGVYVVLNRFNPALLARANDRLQAKPKHTTTDADIIERRWLYIDADPVRPSGISSTDAEHEAALGRAGEIRELLSARGWPDPLYADSGNGAHLLYRLPSLDLPRAGDMVRRCLRALSARFSDGQVKVDEATANAARICKLYGTLTRKGDPTHDRPHRRSRLVEYPERIEPVSVAALEALGAEVGTASSASQGQSHKNSNVDDLIQAAGLEVVKGPEAYQGGRRWTLATCAFNPEHSRPVIIELANGARVYRCLHNSCKQNDWRVFRRRVAPNDLDTSSVGSSPEDSTEGDRHGIITSISQIPSIWTLESHCEWCIPDMIARSSVTLISAESGTGKTWLGYFLAGRVAHGCEVLGRAVRRSRVLYLDGENPLYMVKQRLFDLSIAETPDLTVWGGWNNWPPPGPESPVVIKFVREHQPLIVYDSLIEFHPGSEQSSTETRAFMRRFRALANMGATVIILHHTGKAPTSKEYRGSSDIKAAVDTAYLLERADETTPEIRNLLLKCFKGRLALAQNFSMEFRRGMGFVPADTGKSVSEIIQEVLEEHPRSKQTDIIKLCVARGCSKSQVEAALRNGNWKTERGPKNAKLYVLPKPAASPQELES